MRYPGGKSFYAIDILQTVLKDRKPDQWYVEPFCGGCNVIFKVTGKRIGNDSNKYLIAMYKELQKGWEPKFITEEAYKEIRDNKEMYEDYIVGFVGMACSYQSKWFGGYAGRNYCRVKQNCKNDNYLESNIRSLMKMVPGLKGINFYSGSYDKLEIPKNSLIYCDPPYSKEDGNKKFYGGDNNFNSEMFWQWVRDKKKEGHTVYVSEYQAPEDFKCVWSKRVTSNFDNKKSGLERISCKIDRFEKLFTI